MYAIASLLMITALTIPTGTLVLRSGKRINVDGSVAVEAQRVLFHSNGGFYSVASDEVDFDATRAADESTPSSPAPRGRLRVSAAERDRLLKELENNHFGSPAPASSIDVVPPPTAAERAQTSESEWSWRYQAQAREEAIRRAQEDLDLLRDRADELKAHITGLLALGYKPSQFTYDTTLLANTVEQIPQAELEVRRAQRALDQFRDDARKQDVMPGWLR